MIDFELIKIGVWKNAKGRYVGVLYRDETLVAEIAEFDRPEQAVFDAYSFLVHERNGEIKQ